MINHWDPNPVRARRALEDLRRLVRRNRPKRIELTSGLEIGVEWLTIVDLADLAGVNVKVVRYALAKKVGARGYLEAARRQPGRAGVLIHPDEAQRWIEARKRARLQ